jgi:hypothetical protein
MMIFDFITQDEMDDLPDGDPQSAFTRFVEIARRRLADRTNALTDDESGWREREDAQHGFMNVVIAAAKRFEIEPLASLSVPRATKFSSDVYREFRSDLDHYLTQLLLSNTSRAKRDSILVSPAFKATLRTYVTSLRELVETSEEIDDKKRDELLKHLSDFEFALEKKRLNILAIAALAITFAGAPGALGASADIANKLFVNILRTVGEAKIQDDATRTLPSTAPPLAITGPRSNDSGAQSTRSNIDDDIPF